MASWYESLAGLSSDSKWLMATKGIRMFAYGLISVVLVLFLSELGLSDNSIGLFISFTLLGDTLVSLVVTSQADRVGRRLMLVIGSVLMAFSGIGCALLPADKDLWTGTYGVLMFSVLTVIGIVGVISPSGTEVGPFTALEQSIITQEVSFESRTRVFTYYGVLGYVATAFGALVAGWMTTLLVSTPPPAPAPLPPSPNVTASGSLLGWLPELDRIAAFRIVVASYGILGVVLLVCFAFLSPKVELEHAEEEVVGSEAGGRESTSTAVDGGDVQDSLAQGGGTGSSSNETTPLLAAPAEDSEEAPVKKKKWSFGIDVKPESRPVVFRLCFLMVIDSLASSDHLGLVKTMVFTHLPSNIFIILVPFMPTLPLASICLFIRFSMTKMDTVAKSVFTASIVTASERTAVIGLTNLMKTIGFAIGPALTGWAAQNGYFDYVFVACGVIKIVYDLLLLWFFKDVKVPGERRA
ncbi:hypothetical protein HDU96_002124 [Phlyctochytrium bullatum]|nr:hypothetical protein HDU96_002124 [Phlyctochytrium bullatum]